MHLAYVECSVPFARDVYLKKVAAEFYRGLAYPGSQRVLLYIAGISYMGQISKSRKGHKQCIALKGTDRLWCQEGHWH